MKTLQRLSLETKTIETADVISSEILENTKKTMGMIPNMYSTMANNPALLDAYIYILIKHLDRMLDFHLRSRK